MWGKCSRHIGSISFIDTARCISNLNWTPDICDSIGNDRYREDRATIAYITIISAIRTLQNELKIETEVGSGPDLRQFVHRNAFAILLR